MSKIEKSDIRQLKGQLNRAKNEILRKKNILTLWENTAENRKQNIKVRGYNTSETISELDNISKVFEPLICSLPNFGSKIELSSVSHDLPLLFLDFDDNEQLDNIEIDDKKSHLIFLSCYLLLKGLLKNSKEEDTEKRFFSYIQKMEDYRQSIIEKEGRIKSKKTYLMRKPFEELKNIAYELNRILSSGTPISDDYLNKLKKKILFEETFNYEYVFIFFEHPSFKLLSKQLKPEEILECFEYYLSININSDDCTVDDISLEIFNLLFINYINYYFSNRNYIFDNIIFDGKKMFGGSTVLNYEKYAVLYCEYMSYYLENQQLFIDNNKDILDGIRQEIVKPTPCSLVSKATDTYTEPQKIDQAVKESPKQKNDVYSTRLSSFENILNGDIFVELLVNMIKSCDANILSFLGIDEISMDDEKLKEQLTMIHNSFLDMYLMAHQIASESKNGTLSIYKDGHFIDLQVLPEIDSAIELYNELTNNDDKKEVVYELVNYLRKLNNELSKLYPVDNSEHNVIYYTVTTSKKDLKNERYDTEDICIIDDIDELRKSGQTIALQSCLQTIHDAFTHDNIDGLISNSKPVHGTKGCHVYVKNKKVIYTVVEYNVDGKHIKKIIILGAGNDDNIYRRAQNIANSPEFRKFYKKVSNDSDYSQPLDYADQVFRACNKGKAKTLI